MLAWLREGMTNGPQPGRAEENSPPIHRWVGRFQPGESR